MAQFDATFDPVIFEIANGDDPFLAAELYGIVAAIQNTWGNGQPAERIPTASSTLQGLQHLAGRNVGPFNPNAWIDFQEVVKRLHTFVDPITFHELGRFESHYANLANIEVFEDCGEGLAISIDNTDGVGDALATTTIDFTGATPTYPAVDGNWFIVPTGPLSGEVVWFDVAGSGALLGAVTAEVTAYLAGIPWTATVGGMTFNAVTVDPISQPSDIAIVAAILATVGSVSWLVAGGTATTLTASSILFPISNQPGDLYPNATFGTVSGFAPPGSTVATILAPAVAGSVESTTVTTSVPIHNHNEPAPIHNHNCPMGQWVDVFNANDGTIYRFWMDNGIDPILTPGPGVDVSVPITEGIWYVDLLDILADAIVTATGLVVTKFYGGFTIVQPTNGDVPNVTNGTGGFRSFTGELRLSDGSVLSTEATISDMVTAHNDVRVDAELALSGRQLPYVIHTGIGNWVWKARHLITGDLAFNASSGTTFTEEIEGSGRVDDIAL